MDNESEIDEDNSDSYSEHNLDDESIIDEYDSGNESTYDSDNNESTDDGDLELEVKQGSKEEIESELVSPRISELIKERDTLRKEHPWLWGDDYNKLPLMPPVLPHTLLYKN